MENFFKFFQSTSYHPEMWNPEFPFSSYFCNRDVYKRQTLQASHCLFSPSSIYLMLFVIFFLLQMGLSDIYSRRSHKSFPVHYTFSILLSKHLPLLHNHSMYLRFEMCIRDSKNFICFLMTCFFPLLHKGFIFTILMHQTYH